MTEYAHPKYMPPEPKGLTMLNPGPFLHPPRKPRLAARILAAAERAAWITIAATVAIWWVAQIIVALLAGGV